MPDVMPILPSWDFDETSRFYRALGFREAGRWPDSYLIIDHPAGIELHFFASRRFPKRSNDHGVYVRFATADEVDELHDSWADAGWTSGDLSGGELHDPKDTDYGLREFAVLDSMRNLMRIGGTSRDS